MAKLVISMEQHLDRKQPTVVILATIWWEKILARVKLMECGLGVNRPVSVSQTWLCICNLQLKGVIISHMHSWKWKWTDASLNPQTYIYTFFHSTVVDCRTLHTTTNGQVSYPNRTTFRQIATYSCNTGYNLVGDSTRRCQADGMWSGSEPTCISEPNLTLHL